MSSSGPCDWLAKPLPASRDGRWELATRHRALGLLSLSGVVFEFPFGRIVDTGMACRRYGIIPPGVDILTIAKEAAAVRAAFNQPGQEVKSINDNPGRLQKAP